MFHSCNKCMQGRYQHATQSHADRSFEFPVTVGPPVRVLALLHLTSMQPGCWGASTVWKPELHHWCCCWCFVCFFMLVLMYLIIFTLLGTIYLNSSDRQTSQVKMGNHLFWVKIHSLMYHNLIFFHIFSIHIFSGRRSFTGKPLRDRWCIYQTPIQSKCGPSESRLAALGLSSRVLTNNVA